TKDNNYGNNNLSNLTKILQQHPLPLLDHHNTTAVQPQDNMPKITAGPSNAVAADEGLKTEHSRLLDNSSRHNNYENKSTSAVEDVIISIEDNCREEIIRHHLGHLESVPETMIVYTTIFAYVLSTMLTSIGLLLLVRFKLNSFLEFFPRHIYIGTFGGIGCYLLKTAIKFSVHRSRNYGFDDKTRRAKTKSNHVPIITTLSFLTIFLSFYLVIYSLSIPLEFLIEDGWIFALDDQITMSEFYSNFDFGLINWEAIIKTIPTILTLAYFTILNVNINIGKLKVSLDDNHQLNTDCELIVQGVSNLIAGISGTFQVSFGYEESSLLIKSGINNRVLGLILAFCIGITTYFGQLFIKYIPTIAVGTMIFYLGLEVIKEALIDSWMIFNKLEYLNIIITMFAMITIGLLEGIFIGIVFSYIFFMILNYQKGVIRATFSSNSARSSVRRHYRDQKFLKQLDIDDETICNHQVENAGNTNEKEEFFNSLIPYFKEEILQKDSTLWEEGSNPNFMYVVEEGQLSVTRISAENNKPEQIERILPLNVVGEMGFFTDNLRRTNLVTITPCVLWVINRFAYARMVGDNPILGFNFMRLTMKLSVERLYDYYKN
ncbi:6249_t:CDS:2, partial [Entrophospora sp. SA101]